MPMPAAGRELGGEARMAPRLGHRPRRIPRRRLHRALQQPRAQQPGEPLAHVVARRLRVGVQERAHARGGHGGEPLGAAHGDHVLEDGGDVPGRVAAPGRLPVDQRRAAGPVEQPVVEPRVPVDDGQRRPARAGRGERGRQQRALRQPGEQRAHAVVAREEGGRGAGQQVERPRPQRRERHAARAGVPRRERGGERPQRCGVGGARRRGRGPAASRIRTPAPSAAGWLRASSGASPGSLRASA